MNKKIIILSLVVCLGLGFFAGTQYSKNNTSSILEVEGLKNKEAEKPNDVNFGLFWDAWVKLTDRYVDRSKIDIQNMVYGAIKGMVESIGDPYTVYMEPEKSEAFQEQIRGSFSGVGIEIGIREEVLTVIAPIRDSPAFRAGIVSGDKILEIDGKSTTNMTSDDAVSLIRGEQGTRVTLGIFREGFSETKDYVLTRDVIKIPALTSKILDNNIGYIQLSTFNQNTDSEFRKVAQEFIKDDVKGIVLDVRNNPGGLLDMATYISSWFLEVDKVVVIEDFGNGDKEEIKSMDLGGFKNTPVVMLINKGSASASEILAGALHDNRGIQLIGEKTFGKGSVQQIENLDKGSLKITIAKWLTPNGRSISDEGIEPDIKIELTDKDLEQNKDPQLDKAIEILKTL